ncbi:MAG: diguanylate cyclase [Dehalococcoidia bacterium]|nr:diguanylate cyclase [Dehalococcoidia bacterium]
MKTKQSLLKILVCDDDPADRKLFRAYLKRITDREIVLLEAGEKDEIRNAMDKGRVDLVFMDVQMPEKTGMEWLAEIVEKKTAPVVMLTGFGSEDIAVQSLMEGAVGYLSKGSLSAERLEKTIDAAMERWRQIQQSLASQEQLERLANFDALTGVYNRRAILGRLDEQMRQSERYKTELGMLMLDIDHFKRVNDRYGHLVGDEVLEKFAGLVQENTRDVDAVGRYGGEEFIVVLPQTNTASVLEVAERIRRAVEAAVMQDSQGNAFGITVSTGVSAYRPGDDRLSIISRADDALYKAKENGRNRIESSPAEGD